MSPTLVAIVKSIILPPGILLILLLLCIYAYFKNRKIFIVLSLSTILLLYLFSIPVFSRYLSSIIEPDIALDIEQIKNSDAEVIIVLGCNRQANAPEFNGNDTVSACTLVRLRYAAILHKLTHLPLLVSGGSVFEESNRGSSGWAERVGQASNPMHHPQVRGPSVHAECNHWF